MTVSVRISGTGIASACCARLLSRQGIAVCVDAIERPPVPAILLSDPALALMRDVFASPTLFADKPRIDRRMVSWGGGDAVAVPHGGVVVSEEDLAAAFPVMADLLAGDARPPSFTVHTAAPFPSGAPRRFGSRHAVAAPVRLTHEEDRSACWIEAVADGWLFLIPDGRGHGWLLAVGAPMAALLGQSRHVAPRFTPAGDAPPTAFDSCPRMLPSLCGEHWLACGTAAIAFDPICGDGTAQAMREAILAAAVIGAIGEGEDADALLTHYESMLIAAMRRHLALSAQFYRSGGSGPWWRSELAALMDGHDWCTERLRAMPEPRYLLQDFRLVEREKAA
ncbi:MAG: hypothetical protein EP321_00700 [Sphingomonadales bacterium]|nr:MAG: hypothetical protein EP345_15585 [Sphingomonadales bacterium]TNF06248.1 MAG: hypothetical protein EP321_00700 [Sphingomonadales bacterium]